MQSGSFTGISEIIIPGDTRTLACSPDSLAECDCGRSLELLEVDGRARDEKSSDGDLKRPQCPHQEELQISCAFSLPLLPPTPGEFREADNKLSTGR